MIIKQREMPKHIKTLQCIARRMPDFHPKKPLVAEELYKQIAGYQGEKSSDYYISYLEPAPLVLYNIRLRNGDFHFQIDTILIFNKAIFILEVKNLAGIIEIRSSYDQVLKTTNDQTSAQKSFHTQVKLQKEHLERWVRRNFNMKMPIIPLIIMSNPRSILKAESPELLGNVHPASSIPFAIYHELDKLPSKKHSSKHIMALAELMAASQEELEVDWFERFDFNLKTLLTGMSCPSCEQFAIVQSSMKWSCKNCSLSGFQIVESAIEEAFLLMGEGIRSKELRRFLGGLSAQKMNRIARKAKLYKTGLTKGTKYHCKILGSVEIIEAE
ncbi:nuclease-related domain-containing protein [Jeotgalibacillus haloalkalitolerans]|uniref:Nuclease-related domain-containing protein n=1 Tax=Jeotgalibacillus haloalkalitolerans TaxID=3104292 RepID=A0ABU5KJ77_9BACL|nr:nuclease-related domain-containing protein [Jeotgalibacillus sp. HH7-29]MDZ5711273.1 nuclease-related domain-containing protein [Jeotgalibacillus sp. HH7-29]